MKKDKHNLLRHLLLVTSCLLLLVSILSACTCKKADDVATGSTSNSLDETAADTATGTNTYRMNTKISIPLKSL